MLFNMVFAYSQTVDEIIAKHIDAVGGKEKLNGTTSFRMEGTLEGMGVEISSTIIVLNGKGCRFEGEVNGQKLVTVLTDKGGWQINPFQGSDDPQAMPDKQYKSEEFQIYVEPFLNYADRGTKAELLGQENVGNVNAYKIKLTGRDSSSNTYYLDPSTYYVIQIAGTTNLMGQDMEIKRTCSDYRKTDYGIVFPQNFQDNIGGQYTQTLTVKKIDFNQPVDASIFEMKKL
jgi:hypothetical protein